LYKELLDEADKLDENEHDKLRQINLDLNRTFPEHPFFSDCQYGQIGQQKLKRALRAYAMYNKDVGYTQSINFLIGFFLMVNGGNDEEAFWLFVAITKKNQNFGMVGNFEGGLEGFYSDKFPLYHQFVYQFDRLFESKIPKLKYHFDQIGYPAPVWLQKWFMTLFLYSFPMKLCIRLWDNLLVEGLTLIFKFPLAIMEILEKTLLKWNFEEVNDVLSNLKTIDDPNVNPSQAHLPNIERIINKARSIKLNSEELGNLKKEYESLNQNIKRIKILPQILEEADIYEEVEKMYKKANSLQEDEFDNELIGNEDWKESFLKSERPASAERRFYFNISHSKWIVYPEQQSKRMKSSRSLKGFRDFISPLGIEIGSHLRLPPINDNKQNRERFAQDILKKFNEEGNSFDTVPNKFSRTPRILANIIHRQQKSTPIHTKIFIKNNWLLNNHNPIQEENTSNILNLTEKRRNAGADYKHSISTKSAKKDPWNDKVNQSLLPAYSSFAQSLSRFSSLKVLKHPHTECDILEEIHEEHSESLDNFLLRNQSPREWQSNNFVQFNRFDTEHNNIDNTFSKDKLFDRVNNISYSRKEQMQDSFQQANSDLFLESNKYDRYLPENLESELIDYSNSSSLLEESPADNNSINKTHDTLKGTPFQDLEARSINDNKL